MYVCKCSYIEHATPLFDILSGKPAKMSKISKKRTDCIPDVFELLPIREYRCEFECGKVFKNRSPYELHLRKKHGVDIKENIYISFRCPVENCDYLGRRLNLVRRHYQSHHMEKKYNCAACNRKFLTESQFLKHRCEVQIYSCQRCSRTFNLLSMRNRHVKQCVKKATAPTPLPNASEDDEREDNGADVDTIEKVDADPTIDEFEQLLRNIENNVVNDPALIEELAVLTPILQSLQT
ncbi:zinc finger and BTB domain-containing protein 41 [Drosophila montana]|uniref:zinc finger and BTB domain-containing protein 41 n=1 Tax=Drosophila montana TaxID=40370 RepID=UPI00313A8346